MKLPKDKRSRVSNTVWDISKSPPVATEGFKLIRDGPRHEYTHLGVEGAVTGQSIGQFLRY